MKVHFIAIGGSAMHNLALAMDANGHNVSGSDDEIYEPSLSRLRNVGICPKEFGWFPDRITSEIDIVILGMHAKKDNPELLKAQQIGLEILSYPEFVYQQAKDKKRIVIAGSHGKTTTTSMIIHVLGKLSMDCDYLVGAQLEGFNRMVRLSSSSLMILEGDEYLSSPIDSSSKFSHYYPEISVITGISWDHINVFPTEESYIDRFKSYIANHREGIIYFCKEDETLVDLVETTPSKAKKIGYSRLAMNQNKQVVVDNVEYEYRLIGGHNLENCSAALHVCNSLGIDTDDFFKAMLTFKGAGKRLQKIFEKDNAVGFLDFAHAPSKVKATTEGVKEWFPNFKLLSVLELHTFSSLNKKFLPKYKNSMAAADQSVVFYDAHTIHMKNMEPLDKEFVKRQFNHPNITVFDNKDDFHSFLDKLELVDTSLLLMTSGNLGKYDLNKLNRWA